MQVKTFCASYTDFVKFNKKPNEDFYLVSKRFPIFTVADGVTQSTFASGEYSYPAGAATAAMVFCYEAIDSLENNFKNKNSSILLKNAFDKVNQKIREINEIEGITKKLDYLVYDYFDTVGVAGFLKKDILHYGFVGDCGLAVFNKNNKIKFQTKDQVEPARINASRKHKNWSKLSLAERTIIMHKEFRNCREGDGYGSFSGEEGVKDYYEIGEIKLSPGDLIVFYSDGFLPYFQFKDFTAILRKQNKKMLDNFVIKKSRENPEKFGHDRTFISFNINNHS